MAICVGVPRETLAGERRVAITPGVLKQYAKLDVEICIESGCGEESGFNDADYGDVTVVKSAAEVYARADIILKVQPPTVEESKQFKEGGVALGFMSPHSGDDRLKALCDNKVSAFAMELIPRISRAQSIDALSSQASLAGYQCVLLGAGLSSRLFPMMTTAAGTIRPARVLVIGAGVAGLQAIATAKRLGAIVEGYDVRAATREQVESLGAKFVDTGVTADGAGGYARELTEEEKQQQAKVLAEHVITADVVVTTAAIPGRPAPKIIDEATVAKMKRGAVIVDMAAETGGNCALTKPGETVNQNGVVIHGPLHIPSMTATDASEMYARNLYNFLSLVIKEGKLELNFEDQVIKDSCLTHEGKIHHEPTRNRIEGAQA